MLRHHRLTMQNITWLASALAVFIVNGVWLASPAAAADPHEEKRAKEVHEVAKKIQARYVKTRDLEAQFTQSTKIEGFATPITSTGSLFIKKPGKLRWDYRDPSVEEIYVNGNDVMMYVPEHKQVLVGRLTQMAASQAPLQLLQGAAKLDEHFEIQPTLGGEKGEGGIPLVTLVPRETGPESVRTVVRIVVEAEPKTYFIKSVSIHEVSGNVATFRFHDLKPNSGLSNALFEFTAPPGVEIVKAPTLSPP